MLVAQAPKYKCDKCGIEKEAVHRDNYWDLPKGWNGIPEEWKESGTFTNTDGKWHMCPACIVGMEELRDCPFCGSNHVKLCWHVSSMDSCEIASVLCTNCGTSGKSYNSKQEMKARMLAIEAWNRRAGDFVI